MIYLYELISTLRSSRSATGSTKVWSRLCNHGTACFAFVLVMDTMSGLTGVGGVADNTLLPLLVICELPSEVEGVVDISEAELDVVVLH